MSGVPGAHGLSQEGGRLGGLCSRPQGAARQRGESLSWHATWELWVPRADQGTWGGVPAGPSVCSFCGPSWCLRPASMAWNMGTGRTLLVPTPHSEFALFPLIWGPVGTPLGFPRG